MRIDQRINSKLDQITSLRELAAKATMTLSDMPRSSSPNLQPMEATIAKMIDLEDEINSDIDYLVDLKQELVAIIKQVENTEQQTLLEQRYLCFKPFEQIAVNMNYSIRQTFRVHDEALSSVAGIRSDGY